MDDRQNPETRSLVPARASPRSMPLRDGRSPARSMRVRHVFRSSAERARATSLGRPGTRCAPGRTRQSPRKRGARFPTTTTEPPSAGRRGKESGRANRGEPGPRSPLLGDRSPRPTIIASLDYAWQPRSGRRSSVASAKRRRGYRAAVRPEGQPARVIADGLTVKLVTATHTKPDAWLGADSAG